MGIVSGATMPEHRVASVAQVALGSLMQVSVAGHAICLAHTQEDEWFAIDDACSHQDYSLSAGELWRDEVECAQHGSRFSLATGVALGPPAQHSVGTYAVTIRDGDVYIDHK